MQLTEMAQAGQMTQKKFQPKTEQKPISEAIKAAGSAKPVEQVASATAVASLWQTVQPKVSLSYFIASRRAVRFKHS